MTPEEIQKLFHDTLDKFRFSFDLEVERRGYNRALQRLNEAKRAAVMALNIIDRWVEEQKNGGDKNV